MRTYCIERGTIQPNPNCAILLRLTGYNFSRSSCVCPKTGREMCPVAKVYDDVYALHQGRLIPHDSVAPAMRTLLNRLPQVTDVIGKVI